MELIKKIWDPKLDIVANIFQRKVFGPTDPHLDGCTLLHYQSRTIKTPLVVQGPSPHYLCSDFRLPKQLSDHKLALGVAFLQRE